MHWNGHETEMYSVQQLARVWGVHSATVRKWLRGSDGIVRMSGTGRGKWRIPASLALSVMVERGYSREAAAKLLGAV